MTDILADLMIPNFKRASDFVGAWAMEPRAFQTLLETVRRSDLHEHVANASPMKRQSALGMVSAGNNQTIAVVMLTGSLQKAMSSMSEGTSTIQARADIRKAANDPNVSAILLAIDSPGGTVSGTSDLGAEVRAASAKKPVWAYADDLCASAAYWVASQADKIFANNATALVGSIGTLSVVHDMSAAAESAGIKTLVFGTGPLKGTGAPGAPITEDQQQYIRGIVEDAQTSFDTAVKKGRGMTDSQLAKVKTGGVFGASEALSLNLIDGIKSMDSVLNDLAAEARRFQRANNQRAEGPVTPRSVSVTQLDKAPETVADSDLIVNAAIEKQRKAIADENRRIAKVQAHLAKFPDLCATAVEEGWTAEKAELESMRAELKQSPVRTAGPNFVFGADRFNAGSKTVGDNVNVNTAMECAIRQSLYGRHNESKIAGDYSPEVMQAARENFKNIGLQQAFLLSAAANGYNAGPGERITSGNIREVLKYSLGGVERMAGGSSTISMSGILGNVANKELLAGYVEEDTKWMEIATIKPVSNFQSHTSYRMLDDMEYEELGPDGKIKHGTAGQESYTRQAKTYAKMFAVTRTNIINDDLGAFNDVRTRLGRGSAIKFNKIFWAEFIDNSAFFTAARTNYITGPTTNLGTDGVGLGLGVKAFRTMTSPAADGAKAVAGSSEPDRLIVPPELEQIARALYVGNNLAAVKVSDVNTFAGLYRPVVVRQLSNSSYTGHSTTAWYLLGNPGYLAPMVVSFLNGNMAPTVESADGDFDELCVQFRGYHDFGCDQAEYLCGVKSKGAS